MPIGITLIMILALGAVAWFSARAKAALLAPVPGLKLRNALPGHYGIYVALWAVVPALILFVIWSSISNSLILHDVMANPIASSLPVMDLERDTVLSEAMQLAKNADAAVFGDQSAKFVPVIQAAQTKYGWIGAALVLLFAFAGGGYGYSKIKASFPARNRIERAIMVLLLVASCVAILTTFGIMASLLYESGLFFSVVSPIDFLLGTNWAPDTTAAPTAAIGKSLGALPLFWGTFFIGAIIAMIVAIPLGLMSAIYLTQYASSRLRMYMKPTLEILAGIPTVVYGYFAALTVAPVVRDVAAALGMANPSTESALAAGLVMGIMIIPFVSSMADDSIAAVPQSMRDGSLAMGATPSETIKRVLIPAALPGIVAGIMLAISRAIGETMIVYMAAGASANMSLNPLDRATTVTYQIAALLTGEGSFDHPTTQAAFALGLVLFLITLLLNVIALKVVKRFREAYE
jgi:phosphate transport system permease protein